MALAVSRSGCTFPPLNSGKLARLMLWQRDGGADDVSRWPSASGGSGTGASWPGLPTTGPRVYDSCKIVSGAEARGPVISILGHLVIHLSRAAYLYETTPQLDSV